MENLLRYQQLAVAIAVQVEALETIQIFVWDKESPELKEALGKVLIASQEACRIAGSLLHTNQQRTISEGAGDDWERQRS